MTPCPARVAAVIPNWNGRGLLEPLLDDIAAQTRPFDSVVLADNHSTDGSDREAERRGHTVLRLGANLGFARAVNRGVRQACDADLVAILNNDVRLAPDWLERILTGLNTHESYACGKIFSALHPELLDATFDTVCRGGTALRSGASRPDSPFWSEPRAITFAPFTAVLIRRNFFLGLGGLDEDFGSYLEDVEFGLRCGSGGHTGRYVPGAVAWHVGSATRGRWNPETVRQIARNQVLLIARHYPPALVREFGWPIAVSHLLWGLVALRHGRGTAWLRGKWDGLRQFRRYRCRGSASVRVILRESERELRRIQAATGRDWYWRLYCALVR